MTLFIVEIAPQFVDVTMRSPDEALMYVRGSWLWIERVRVAASNVQIDTDSTVGAIRTPATRTTAVEQIVRLNHRLATR
jgi:hypothetical protein